MVVHLQYDTPVYSVLERMKRYLIIDVGGWAREDFDEMTSAEVKAEYLAAGGEDLRPGS